MIAVDASVAVKWLWPEPGHEEAKQLLKSETRLVAPIIIKLEVAGAVLRRCREKSITESEAHSLLGLWSRIVSTGTLHLVPIEDVYDLAIAVSFGARHALADCLYVAVGTDLKIPLITADETLHKRCKTVYDNIQLLTAHGVH